MFEKLRVFSGSSNPQLAEDICRHLGIELGKAKTIRFSNNNIKIKIEENVRSKDVFIIQTAAPPVNEHLMELLIFIDALRYASADRITAVMPYYFYARSDKKDEPRISITARLVADLLETAGAHRILTMKLHSPQIMGFSHIPIDQLLATQIMVDHYKTKDLSNMVIAAPDVGSAKGSRTFAKALGRPLVILDKERRGDEEEVEVRTIIGDASGKDALIIDDEILTGRSTLQAAYTLKEHGAQRILAGCTHGFFSQNACERFMNSAVEEVVVTDTVPLHLQQPCDKIKVLGVGKLFADGIQAIHEGTSVGALFSSLE